MTEPQLQDLLDMAYELEGLITLALNRPGAPARIHTLIEAKAYGIADAAAAHTRGAEQAEEPAEPAPIAEPTPEPEEAVETEETEETEEVEEAAPAPQEIVGESIFEVPASAPIADEQPAAKSTRPLRTYFALNDKFRFRRELFGGNDAAMTAAINALAEKQTLSEAEDYVYSDLGLDPDMDATREFVEVITPYYSGR